MGHSDLKKSNVGICLLFCYFISWEVLIISPHEDSGEDLGLGPMVIPPWLGIDVATIIISM